MNDSDLKYFWQNQTRNKLIVFSRQNYQQGTACNERSLGRTPLPQTVPRCLHYCCVIACQSSATEALQALAYLSKVRNSSSVVAIRVLKLYGAHHPSYGNNLSSCKLQAWKTCPESREDTLCPALSIIRVCLEMGTVLVKRDLPQRDVLVFSKGWVSPTLPDYTTAAVSVCLEGITCSFLRHSGFHVEVSHVTSAMQLKDAGAEDLGEATICLQLEREENKSCGQVS